MSDFQEETYTKGQRIALQLSRNMQGFGVELPRI